MTTTPPREQLPPHFLNDHNFPTGEQCKVIKDYAELYAREALRAQAASEQLPPVTLDRFTIIGLISPLSNNSADHDIDFAYRVIEAMGGQAASVEPDGEAPTLAALADKMHEACQEFWSVSRREGIGGAVRWVEFSDGAMIVFTRGEYREQLLANIEPSDDEFSFSDGDGGVAKVRAAPAHIPADVEPVAMAKDGQLFWRGNPMDHRGESCDLYRGPAHTPAGAGPVIQYTPGQWFEAKTREELRAFFLSRLPAIREAAKDHGYAIGLHGTLTRDMDLIAVPWRDGASDNDTLAHAVANAACGITRDGAYDWESKPAGRVATSIPCCWPSWHGEAGAGHIDLSVVSSAPAHIPADVSPPQAPKALVENIEWLTEYCRTPVDPDGQHLPRLRSLLAALATKGADHGA